MVERATNLLCVCVSPRTGSGREAGGEWCAGAQNQTGDLQSTPRTASGHGSPQSSHTGPHLLPTDGRSHPLPITPSHYHILTLPITHSPSHPPHHTLTLSHPHTPHHTHTVTFTLSHPPYHTHTLRNTRQTVGNLKHTCT